MEILCVYCSSLDTGMRLYPVESLAFIWACFHGENLHTFTGMVACQRDICVILVAAPQYI